MIVKNHFETAPFFASAAVAPQGASRWHLNQIYCECEAFTVNPHAHFGAPRFMKAFAAHGDFFASAAVAPQGASRWHLNQIYCECEAFTVKPRRVCRPQAAKKLESFSAGACTWQKIPLRLQVWNLFAAGEQIMRAAACKTLSKSPAGDF